MSTFLPREVQDGLDAARQRDQRRNSRMMVEANGQTYRILKFWDDGFVLECKDDVHLRGFVDIYDRGHHMFEALIVATSQEAGLMTYAVKRMTAISETAPRDYVDTPVKVHGLLGGDAAR